MRATNVLRSCRLDPRWCGASCSLLRSRSREPQTAGGGSTDPAGSSATSAAAAAAESPSASTAPLLFPQLLGQSDLLK